MPRSHSPYEDRSQEGFFILYARSWREESPVFSPMGEQESRPRHGLADLQNGFAFFLQRRHQAVGVIAHDSMNARFYQEPHVGGLIDGPANYLQVLFPSLIEQSGRNQVSPNR